MTTTDSAPTTDAEEISVATAAVLGAVEDIFADYVVFPSDYARDAVVLWVAHAHVFSAFETTPRLSICSTEPGSGKSRVLEVIRYLVPAPFRAIQMTPAVVWRKIEHSAPTLLMDEVDTIFGKNGSGSSHRYLRGILNEGHSKGGTISRTVGAEDVKDFNVFAPVAMAGLGHLPETLRTRSVEIRMRKRRQGEDVRPFRIKYAQDALTRVRDMLESWSMDAGDLLELSCPEMPVQDRDADVWEPLIAIAEMAGDEWYDRAVKACEELTGSSKGATVTPGVRLLTALREVFGDSPSMFTSDILAALHNLPDSPWRTLTPRALSNILREYDVRPTTVRQGEEIAKGYLSDAFADAWGKYVTAVTE